MPSNKLVYGSRVNPLNQKLYKQYIQETGSDIDYKTFVKIISTTNEIIRESVIEEEAGVKLPLSLGNIVVTKYKSKKSFPDWKLTKEYKKKIFHVNLHSLGFIHHIKWFKIGSDFSNKNIYKFQPYRILKRGVAKQIKEGKQYFKWEYSDFWSSTKLERNLLKFYKKTNNDVSY